MQTHSALTTNVCEEKRNRNRFTTVRKYDQIMMNSERQETEIKKGKPSDRHYEKHKTHQLTGRDPAYYQKN